MIPLKGTRGAYLTDFSLNFKHRVGVGTFFTPLTSDKCLLFDSASAALDSSTDEFPGLHLAINCLFFPVKDDLIEICT